MSEMAKTLVFVGVAVVAMLGGFATQSGYEEFDVQAEVGKLLNKFEVEEAKRLKIVTFDRETATSQEFEVAEEDGLWTIPSKQDYPADAVTQMAAAATGLIDREILRVAAESADQHAELGLVDPAATNLSTSSQGVGTRVTMTDNDGDPLADMIIGKEVLDAEEQYYVRNADQDYAYVINLDPTPLTTQFENWIEKDLLKLNAMDIRRVHIKDYSAEFQPVLTAGGIHTQVGWGRRGEYSLRYDNSESKWVADRLQVFDPDKGERGELVDFTLSEEEELDEDALRDLRNALDDLAIVDVERKPEGLSADLKAGSDFLQNPETPRDLISRGFGPVSIDNQFEILSSEGEIICTMEDGVEYILRFGNLKLATDGESAEPIDADPNAEGDDGIHRYLFVMARFNEDQLEQPELTELPELPEGADAPTDSEQESDEEPAAEETQSSEPESNEAESSAETEEADSSESEGTDAESTDDTEQGDDQKDNVAELIAAREAIEKENQRLLKEYQDKVEAAQEEVKDLNDRFGDWYYVIDNTVYKKIHLSRDDVVKEKEKPAEETAESEANAGGVPGIPNLPGLSQ